MINCWKGIQQLRARLDGVPQGYMIVHLPSTPSFSSIHFSFCLSNLLTSMSLLPSSLSHLPFYSPFSPCLSTVKQIPHISLSDLCRLPLSANQGCLNVGTWLHICVLLIKIKSLRQMNNNINQLFITAMIINCMHSLTSLILHISGGQRAQPVLSTALIFSNSHLTFVLRWSVVV